MKIFEKILLGFLILVFIGSLLIPVFIGSFSFYSFYDALTNTLLWGIPCLFIWVIVKIFIYFTKKKERIEKTKNIEETEKVKKTENISKKTIILVLIVLIIINTIFWLNLTIKTFAGLNDYFKKELKEKGIVLGVGGGKIDWSKVKKGALSKEEEEEREKRREIENAIRNTITYRMIKTFEGRESMLITFFIITDVVLIAISFMIILLYKKE